MRQIGPALDAQRVARAFQLSCQRNAARPWRERLWIIVDVDTATDAGLIGLRRAAASSLHAELGVLLPPSWQERGMASAAIRKLISLALGDLGLCELRTRHRSGHEAAAALMRKTGFRPVEANDTSEFACHWQLTASCGTGGERIHAPRHEDGSAEGVAHFVANERDRMLDPE